MQAPSTEKQTGDSEIAAAKARAVDEVRQQVWDAKTKKSMGGICVGC